MIDNAIHTDQKRKEPEKLELLLLESLKEGHFQEVTPKFFEQLRERARQLTEHSITGEQISGGNVLAGSERPIEGAGVAQRSGVVV